MKSKQFFNFILDLLFTKRCKICGGICDLHKELCESCAEESSRIEGEICLKCGLPKKECVCKTPPFFMSVCAPFYYEKGPKKAIALLKFKNDKGVTENLAKEMAECVRTRYKGFDFDCCTFTPAHKKDIKNRGYNQAERLALIVAKELDIPCYSLIQKDYLTKSQRSLPAILRTGNLAGAFSFSNDTGIDVKDMRILLCDDLKTTGATLNESTKILLFNGAAEVRCITACIKKKEK